MIFRKENAILKKRELKMITRYDVKEISQFWTDHHRFKTFLQVELALLKALEAKKIIPDGTHLAFKDLTIDPQRISEIEETTRHDIIAFSTSLTEKVDPQIGKYFHFGVTSSDIIDTALSLQLRSSLNVILEDLNLLLEQLKNQILKTSDLLSIGRSHGMYAEPMIFAQKFLSFHQEILRRKNEYEKIIKEELTGQFSGAVGNYTVIDPEIEEIALKELNLSPEKVSTQVIPRDHLSKLISIGALMATTLERMAVEFRLLHHSDVREISEGFKTGQKGSSTMPHKKNPISSENISGLCRVIRSHLDIALQNEVLWHERDISHSSAERLYLPDHFGLLAYTIRRMTSTVRDLVINREHIESKALNNATALSSYILHEMILLNAHSREELYSIVQEVSFSSKTSGEFAQNLKDLSDQRKIKIPKIPDPIELKNIYLSRFKKVLSRCDLK
jgi:adenylosuccinate lyase